MKKVNRLIIAVAFILYVSEIEGNILREKLQLIETSRIRNQSHATGNNDDIQKFWERTISKASQLLRELILAVEVSASNKPVERQIQNCSVFTSRQHEVEDKCWCTYRKEIVKIYNSAITDFVEASHANFTDNFSLNTLNIMEGGYRRFIRRVNAVHKNAKEPLTPHNLFYSLHFDDSEMNSDNYFEINISNLRDWFWGVLKSKRVHFYNVCERFRLPALGTKKTKNYLCRCISTKLIIITNELMNCIYSSKEHRRVPLLWNDNSVFFDTVCLCVLSDMKDCSMMISSEVPDRDYCILQLLKDLQKHVTHRPAVTYMDYSLKTRVSIRSFTALLESTFRSRCSSFISDGEREMALCFFDGLVNKELGCSNKSSVDSLDLSTLCSVQHLLKFIMSREAESDMQVMFYWYKHSPVTLMFAFVDLLLRILTVFTYLSTRELRNLPGKIFIVYQITSILNIIFTSVSFLDKNISVYVNKYLDLVVICWLNAGYYFFYISMKSLIVPSAYHPDLARAIFLKYTLYSWGLPAVLTTAFAYVDAVTDSRFEYGQFGFVIAGLSILTTNLVMFFLNIRTYYSIKKEALEFRVGATMRSYYLEFLKFISKTLILSGIGILARILILQIEATEIHLNVCYILSTLQGLILFIMFAFKQLRSKLSCKCTWLISNFTIKTERRLKSISNSTPMPSISRLRDV